MTCDLDLVDCLNIKEANYRLKRYATDIKRDRDKYIKDYGEDDAVVESMLGRLNDVLEVRTNLLKIANKCGCK